MSMHDSEVNAAFRSIIYRIRETVGEIEYQFPEDKKSSRSLFPEAGRAGNVPVKSASFVHLYEILAGEPAAFVNKAYQYIFQREADENGFNNYLLRLRRGESRLLILHELRSSPEGAAQRVPVTGWGWLHIPVRIHAWLQSLPLGNRRLALIRKVPCKIIAKSLALYEKAWLPRKRFFVWSMIIDQRFSALQQNVSSALEELDSNLTEIKRTVDLRFSQHQEWLSNHDRELAGNKEWLLNHNRDLQSLTEELHQQEENLSVSGKRLSLLGKSLEEQRQALNEQGKRTSLVRQDALYQQYHLRHLLQEISGQIDQVTPPEAGRYLGEYMDAYYIAFEDANRGSLEEIRQKLSVYLPYVKPFRQRTGELPFLDIGCGRGEWLQLLKDGGFNAYGVDTNGVMAGVNREQGLDVRHEDALAHLQGLPDSSLSVITSFHVIEHLPFPVLFHLLMEINRVLIPEGLLILETPNPENILVGSHTFYHDFTHRNPVTPSALSFLVQYHDFQDIEIVRLHPYPDEAKVPGNDPLTQRVNGHLCGPQDYALIARRSSAVFSPAASEGDAPQAPVRVAEGMADAPVADG